MRLRLLLLFPWICLLGAASARAQTRAPSVDVAGGCVAASVDLLASTGREALYRILFVNRCGAPRSFFWCAESPGAPVPAAVACPKGRGVPAEPRHAIIHRKEFQWHLPRGSRIRVHDCAGQDIPTAEFGCAAP
jgi:hypothetical protein